MANTFGLSEIYAENIAHAWTLAFIESSSVCVVGCT